MRSKKRVRGAFRAPDGLPGRGDLVPLCHCVVTLCGCVPAPGCVCSGRSGRWMCPSRRGTTPSSTSTSRCARTGRLASGSLLKTGLAPARVRAHAHDTHAGRACCALHDGSAPEPRRCQGLDASMCVPVPAPVSGGLVVSVRACAYACVNVCACVCARAHACMRVRVYACARFARVLNLKDFEKASKLRVEDGYFGRQDFESASSVTVLESKPACYPCDAPVYSCSLLTLALARYISCPPSHHPPPPVPASLPHVTSHVLWSRVLAADASPHCSGPGRGKSGC
jgi:hypothetical protein